MAWPMGQNFIWSTKMYYTLSRTYFTSWKEYRPWAWCTDIQTFTIIVSLLANRSGDIFITYTQTVIQSSMYMYRIHVRKLFQESDKLSIHPISIQINLTPFFIKFKVKVKFQRNVELRKMPVKHFIYIIEQLTSTPKSSSIPSKQQPKHSVIFWYFNMLTVKTQIYVFTSPVNLAYNRKSILTMTKSCTTNNILCFYEALLIVCKRFLIGS